MQICPHRDAFARDLEGGSSPEDRFKSLEIGQTPLRRRLCAQQGPKRPTVNGADGGMISHPATDSDLRTVTRLVADVHGATDSGAELLKRLGPPESTFALAGRLSTLLTRPRTACGVRVWMNVGSATSVE